MVIFSLNISCSIFQQMFIFMFEVVIDCLMLTFATRLLGGGQPLVTSGPGANVCGYRGVCRHWVLWVKGSNCTVVIVSLLVRK